MTFPDDSFAIQQLIAEMSLSAFGKMPISFDVLLLSAGKQQTYDEETDVKEIVELLSTKYGWNNKIFWLERRVKFTDGSLTPIFISLFLENFESSWFDFSENFETGWFLESLYDEKFVDNFESNWFIINPYSQLFLENFQNGGW